MKTDVVEGLLYLKTEELEAYAVCDEETNIWHAVLGNYDPDVDGWALPSVKQSLDSSRTVGRTTQRLCDKRLVPYQHVSIRSLSGADPLTICVDCIRIKKLMVEFATKYSEEVEDGAADDADEESLSIP